MVERGGSGEAEGDEGAATAPSDEAATGGTPHRPTTPAAILGVGLGGIGALAVVGLGGPLPLLVARLVLLAVAVTTAVLWALGRMSSAWALACAWAVTLGAILVTIAGPGGGSFMTLLVDGATLLLLTLLWGAMVVSRLVSDRGGSPLPLVVVPILMLGAYVVARADLPTRARFALSRPALDELAGAATSRTLGEPAPAPTAVGGYEVQWVDVQPDGTVVVAIAGDCGWFAQCTLVRAPSRPWRSMDLGGGWYSVVSGD